MISTLRAFIALSAVVVIGALAEGQTVLYDFQNEPSENDYPNTFGHFGTITLDSGLIQDCDGVVGEVCRFHTGLFNDPGPFTDPSRFGLIEIGPEALNPPESRVLDMTGFAGFSVDARLIRDTDGPGGFDDFVGIAPLAIGIQWDPTDDCAGSMDDCSDVYAEKVNLTETFETYTVMFDDFVPLGTPLDSVQIKMILFTGEWDGSVVPAVKLSDLSSGVGRLEFDNIIGIPIPEPSSWLLLAFGSAGLAFFPRFRSRLEEEREKTSDSTCIIQPS